VPYLEPSDEHVAELLRGARRLAIVGISNKPHRPSNDVAAYMREAGYEIVPVNPSIAEWDGIPAVAALKDVEGPIDIAVVFRRAEETPDVARDAVEAGAKALWLQLSIVNQEAHDIAQAAGLDVVMDRCIKIEHRRLL